ncbi:MAG: transposase [Verrucomicrobiota bacterium]
MSDQSVYFLTICCKQRSHNDLVQNGIPEKLLESAAFYERQRKWLCRLMVLMPDHLHGLFVFPQDASVTKTITAWKSHHARKTGIKWQDGFFENRIRNDTEFDEKSAYILKNPLRAGLVKEVDDWPFVHDTRNPPRRIPTDGRQAGGY